VANCLLHPNYCEGARCMTTCATFFAPIGFTIRFFELSSRDLVGRLITEPASTLVAGAGTRC
jgi:hypothetical protein